MTEETERFIEDFEKLCEEYIGNEMADYSYLKKEVLEVLDDCFGDEDKK